MGRAKKLSKEELLLRKRLRERERYNKIKNDEVQKEIMKEKEKKKYENKKKKNQRKLVKDMTPREKRQARKKWKKYSNDYYKRKKNTDNVRYPGSPPSSDNEVPNLPAPHQRNSGRKKVHRDRSKIIKRNKKLTADNLRLEKLRNKYKSRYYRLLNKYKSGQELTPKSKVRKIMAVNNRNVVARRLLFGEVLEAQLKSNLDKIKCKKTKFTVISKILGNKQILKKYQLVNDFHKIIPYRPARYCLTSNKIRKQRNEALRLKIKSDVQQYLEKDENSRMAPGKKDFITRKKIKKQKRYLNETMLKLYPQFQKEVGYKIAYSLFCKLRPFWVCYQKLDDRDTCQCRKHVNSDYVVKALKKHNIIKEKTAKEIAEKMCCPGYNVDCLMRKCSTCSSKSLEISEFDGNLEVFYYCWVQKKDQYTNINGIAKCVNNIVKLCKKTNALSLVKSLDSVIIDFMKHESIIRNQFSAISYLKLHMDDNDALLQMDFSENYSLKHAEEIQSFHFGGSRKQITLHTSSLLMKDTAYASPKVKSFCTLSEDLRHDAFAVFAHLRPIFLYLQKEKPNLKALHFVSDSPSTQYRNKTIFFQFAHLLNEYFPTLKFTTWNYLEAGHGKGMPDGIGGTVKRTADRAVNEGKDIGSFESLIDILKDNLRSIHIEIVEGDQITEAKSNIDETKLITFKGSMKIHQVINITEISKASTNTLFMKSMSCFKCFYDNKSLIQGKPLTCKHNDLGTLVYPAQNTACKNKKEIRKHRNSDDEGTSHDGLPADDFQCHIGPGSSTPSKTSLLDSSSEQLINVNDYILVRFENQGKSNKIHQFVGVCQEIVNFEVKVMFLKEVNKDKDLFLVNENDISFISTNQVVCILPEPTLLLKGDRVFYKFKYSLPIY